MPGKIYSISEKKMDQVACLVAYTLQVPYGVLRDPVKDDKEKLLCAYLCCKMGVDVKEVSDFFKLYPGYLKNKIEDVEIKRLYDDDLEALVDVFMSDLEYTNKHSAKLRLGFEI